MDPNVEHTVDSSTTATDNSQQQEGFNPIDQPPRPSGINTGFALTFASAPSYHESSYETPQEQTESPSGPFRLSSASSAGSGSSFGQRMRARKPNGLKLNLSGPSSAESSGAWDQTPKTGQQMAFGSGGEMARRQHHSTWSAKTPATPAPIGFRRAGYQQNRYVTLNGVGQDPVSAGSDVATPKDLSGTINSLRKDLVTRNLGTSGLRVNAAMAFDDDGMAPPTPTIASSSATETVLGNRDQMAMGTPSLQLPPVTPFTLAGLSSDLLLQRHQQNKQQWGSLRPAQTLAGEQVTGLSFIEPGEFAEKMARDECGLVVDVRKAAQHTQSRVSTAVSMAVPTTLLKRKSSTVEQISGILMLSDEQKARLAGWKTGPWVVLYGDGTAEETASEDSPLVMLARKFMSEAGDACSVLVLRGGFDGYSKIYQDSCETGCGQISSPVIDLSNTSHIAHDHPLLRKMRQTPGGGFNPTEIVSMRLPPDFSASNQASPTKSQLQKLPEYLRRAADPQTGAQLLFKLFKKVDASEARRMSSMITNNGMVTNENRFTISAGLELGSKNRYTNIWPFDGNRVKLRSSGRKSHQQPNETPGLPPEMQHLMQKRPATTTAGNTLAARLTSYMAAKSSSEAESAKSRSSAAASASSSQSPPQLNVDLASVPASKKLNSKLKLSSVRPQSISTLMTPRATDNSNNKLWQVDEGTTKRSSFRVESKSKPMMASSLDSDSVTEDPPSPTVTAPANQLRITNDYVNASYISYFDGPLYIATQGPLPDTVNDFWKMVWEHHSRVIVMLTKEFEGNRPKCHHYWPAKIGESVTYDDITVQWDAEAEHPDDASVVSRRFAVTRPAESDATVYITHLQYVGWPDHGVPDNPLGVLRLRQLARRAQEEGEHQASAATGDDSAAAAAAAAPMPMIVHCSAGCGRTGAFCVIDTVLSMQEKKQKASSEPQEKSAEKESGHARHQSLGEWTDEPSQEFQKDLVFMVVMRFRELRITMVQTNRQFVFCHEALAWCALGVGPRPLERILDPRLMYEWNRSRSNGLDDNACGDLTYMLRAWQEMATMMMQTDRSTVTDGDGAETVGRASIDVSGSGSLTGRNRLSMLVPESALKRSNTIGVTKRGLIGALFRSGSNNGDKRAESADADSGTEQQQEQQQRRPAVQQLFTSSEPVTHTATAAATPSATDHDGDIDMQSPEVQAAVEAALSQERQFNASAKSPQAPAPPPPLRSRSNMQLSFIGEHGVIDYASVRTAPRLIGVQTPAPVSMTHAHTAYDDDGYFGSQIKMAFTPPPLRSNESQHTSNDYFGNVASSRNSTAIDTSSSHFDSNSHAGGNRGFGYVSPGSRQGGSSGFLDMYVEPPSSTAEDWRRSVLGRLAIDVDVTSPIGPQAGQATQQNQQPPPGSPYSPSVPPPHHSPRVM